MSEFDFVVEVSADDWAYCQRRLTFLETLVICLSRDGMQLQEWFDAGELCDLRLPGLPGDRSAMARRAATGRWPKQKIGRRTVYHVSGLPARAFDNLLSRMLDLDALGAEEIEPPPEPAGPAAPAWVLPLLTLIRGDAEGDVIKAWKELPEHLPAGAQIPTVDEVATVLVDLGLTKRMTSWREH